MTQPGFYCFTPFNPVLASCVARVFNKRNTRVVRFYSWAGEPMKLTANKVEERTMRMIPVTIAEAEKWGSFVQLVRSRI